MARLAGVDLPRDKRVEVALTYVFGIGRTLAQRTLSETGISPDTRVRDLAEEDLVKIREYVDNNLQTEGDLRREIAARHPPQGRDRLLRGSCVTAAVFPVHGQRTKTNARTRKGPRRAIAGKKKPGKK